jgi:lipopolysaccharide biosynthesis glycosyltransferase
MKCACIFSLDDAYVVPFMVFFHSLIGTDSVPESTPLYFLHTSSLNLESQNTLSGHLARYNRTATFLDVSLSVPSDLPIWKGSYYSLANYFRLFIADILPPDLTHAVYLDSDMIAIRCVNELFEYKYPTPIAAVDQLSPWQSVRMWGDAGGSYFQTGVMLASLTHWRENHLSSLFISIINENRDRLLCVDQDVLNIAFRNNWTPLPIGFNVEVEAIKSLSAEWLSNNVRIAHFSGPDKPWNTYDRPYVSYWDQAYKDVFGVSFNRDQFKPSFSLRTYIKKLSRKHF